MNKDRVIFDISIWAILKVLAVLLAVKIIVSIFDIILLFYIVLVVVAALSPVVDRWSKKMNRVAAISLIYLILFLALSAIFLIVFPPLIKEIQELSQSLPSYLNLYFPESSSIEGLSAVREGDFSNIANKLSGFTNQIYSATRGVFGGLVAVFTIIVLTFYLLLEEHGAKKFILQYLPIADRERIVSIVQKIGHKMGAWMRSQLLLGLIIGVVTGVGLTILGVPYILTLAVWAGFTELIPYVGPVIGAVPAIFLAFTISPVVGVLTIALYVIVQQLEANFLVPKIMQKAVGLSPVIIILSLLIGGKLAGLLGVMLAIPTAVIVDVLISEWPTYRSSLSNQYNKIRRNTDSQSA